ncbi:MAG TPA: cupredoxin family copper-binding protein [Solirubrobacterales bacterium]|nr:cupredoxin family copper-binding protein [Solirubrobacterales bacterium]
MPMTRIVLVLPLVLLAFVLSSCGDDDNTDTSDTAGGVTETTEETTPSSESDANAPAPSGEAVRSEKVEIVDFAYDPDPTTIQAGGKVAWINRDSAPHTATADDGSFDTGTIEEGKLKSESFKQPGTYTYFCEIHPDMQGTVEVVESS